MSEKGAPGCLVDAALGKGTHDNRARLAQHDIYPRGTHTLTSVLRHYQHRAVAHGQ